MKTLGELTYNAGDQVWGPWNKVPQSVRDVYEADAKATERIVLRRLRAKKKGRK